MRVTRAQFAAAFVVAALLAVGCADKNANVRGSVTGRVTLDGSPLAKGAITFEPTAGTRGPAAGGEIVNGRIDIPVAKGPAIGNNIVRVTAPQPTGRQVPGGTTGELVDEIAETVPKRYNTATTLQAEIKKGRNEINFDLTTSKE
jgi:hypothetical protein